MLSFVYAIHTCKYVIQKVTGCMYVEQHVQSLE